MKERSCDNLALYFNEHVISVIERKDGSVAIFFEDEEGKTDVVIIPSFILRNYEIDFPEEDEK